MHKTQKGQLLFILTTIHKAFKDHVLWNTLYIRWKPLFKVYCTDQLFIFISILSTTIL